MTLYSISFHPYLVFNPNTLFSSVFSLCLLVLLFNCVCTMIRFLPMTARTNCYAGGGQISAVQGLHRKFATPNQVGEPTIYSWLQLC